MEQKTCKHCNKIFNKINIKQLRYSEEHYEYCSICRKYRGICTVCGKEKFNQGISCSKECAYELKKKSWLITCGSAHNFCKKSISRIAWEDTLKKMKE